MAANISLLASGLFFLVGLLTGVWKYLAIRKSPDAEAPRYVAVAHRASLMYAFAALLLMKFAEFSSFSDGVNLAAAALPLSFFAAAMIVYILHGVIGDTENQFRRPYQLGKIVITPAVFNLLNWLLILGEIGGFIVLFIGACRTLFMGSM